jgi:ABC-type multidrug transport system fused ATPase/permease subunit
LKRIGRAGELIAFAGADTVRSACVQWALSLLFFGLELSFAFLLQRFLAALGLLSVSSDPATSIPVLLSLTLAQIVGLIFIVTFARMVVGFIRGVMDAGAIERFAHRLRETLIANCLHATTVNSAATLTFFNQRIYTASMAIHSLQLLAWQITMAVGLIVALLTMSARLTLAMTAILLLLVLIPARLLNRRLKTSAKLHADTFSQIMLHLNNVFRNFLLIRLYNLQGRERSRIHGHLQHYSRLILQYHRYDALTGTVGPFMIAISVLLIALAQHSTAAMDRALVVPYLYLFFRLSQTLVPVVQNFARLSFTSTELRTTFEWWRENRVHPDASAVTNAPPLRQPIGWTLRDVSFGYPDQPLIVDGLALDVPPGSLLRLRGPSGAGKSSLVALLAGEAQPLRGRVEVTLDGERFPISDAAARMRDHIGYSSSEPFLFAGTIYENITYGLVTPPDADALEEATALAECQFIHDLPAGFDHPLDELGQGLSTGQKQRLSLLRALLRNPKALLLDEALSNVDAPTEARILSRLVARKDRCTIVFVSHREHATLNADRVIDLEAQRL